MIYNGQGMEKNDKEVVQWLRSAAEQGLVEAQFMLGDMLYHGEGVEKNCTEAVQWFRLAAEQGDARAQLNLGTWQYKPPAVADIPIEFIRSSFAILSTLLSTPILMATPFPALSPSRHPLATISPPYSPFSFSPP